MKNLSPQMKSILLRVNKKHIAAMGATEKEKHSLDNIKKVTVHKDHLKVYYKHDWYHYTPSCDWY